MRTFRTIAAFLLASAACSSPSPHASTTATATATADAVSDGPTTPATSDVTSDDASDATAAPEIAQAPCASACDDGNLCTYDLCNPKSGSCSALPLPASTTCTTDDDPCTAQWCDGAGLCVVYAADECQ